MKFIHPISFFSNLHTYFYLTQSLIQELNHFDDQTSIMFLRWIQGMGSNLHHRWMWTNSFISQSALISTLLWYLYFKYDLWRSSDLQNSISLDPISYTHPESIGKTIKSKNQKSTLQSRALIWCSKHLELSSSQVSTVNPLRVLHHQNLSQVSSTWTNHLNIFIKKKEKRKKKIYVCSCTLEFFLLIAFVFQQFLGKLIKISETGWWDLNQPLKDKDIKKFSVYRKYIYISSEINHQPFLEWVLIYTAGSWWIDIRIGFLSVNQSEGCIAISFWYQDPIVDDPISDLPFFFFFILESITDSSLTWLSNEIGSILSEEINHTRACP